MSETRKESPMRKLFIYTLIAALLLTACSGLGSKGTLSIDAQSVDHIEVSLGNGEYLTVNDRSDISDIVRKINSLTLDTEGENTASYDYDVNLCDANGNVIDAIMLLDKTAVLYDSQVYTVTDPSLYQAVEALECATLTDRELIDRLLNGDTLSDLSITDVNGKISLDKITGLSKSCPALFELMHRSSAIESVGTYGVDWVRSAWNSEDNAVREKAETFAQIIKTVFPDLKDEIEKIIENNA